MALGRCTRTSLYFYSIAVLAMLLLAGCGLGGPAGKYVSEKNSNDYLELKSDGTFIVFEGRSGFTGKYEIDGDQIILKADIGTADRGRLEGQTIIDNEGARWTKQRARPAGSAQGEPGRPAGSAEMAPEPPGMYLVLRVQTDDALRVDTETTMERLRKSAETKGISTVTVTLVSPIQFRAEGVRHTQDTEFRQAANEVQTTFNRESGAGGTYTFVMKPSIATQLREAAVAQTLQTIERRLNELGVPKPTVSRKGAASDMITVQLPGVALTPRVKEIIRSTAMLELKLVEAGPAATKEGLLQMRSGPVPPDMDVVLGVSDAGRPGERPEKVYYLVRRAAIVTGRDLRTAKPILDEKNRPAVSFSLNQDGERKFGAAIGDNVGRRLAIILDGRVMSAPVIQSRAFEGGRISGTFTQEDAQDLSLVLRSGELPASVTYLEEGVLQPSTTRK